MDQKEARRIRFFVVKLSFVLLLLLVMIGFLPHARIAGGVAYRPTTEGVWLGETSVTDSLTLTTPALLSVSVLSQIASGERPADSVPSLTTLLDVSVVKDVLQKKKVMFGRFESPFKNKETPIDGLLQLFADAHAQFQQKLGDCLKKLSHSFDHNTEFIMTTQPVYTRGMIPHYNADWVYVSAVFSVYVGPTKICQVKSNCVGTVKEDTGEQGSCW